MKIEKMKRIEFKMLTKPDLKNSHLGWMQVRVDISHNGLRKVTYVVESNGFGNTALVGRNSINDVKTFISGENIHLTWTLLNLSLKMIIIDLLILQ